MSSLEIYSEPVSAEFGSSLKELKPNKQRYCSAAEKLSALHAKGQTLVDIQWKQLDHTLRLMSSKQNHQLLTTTQAVSFLVAFVVAILLWFQFLFRWTSEGVIALQPVILSDYIIILGLFVVVPFVIISVFIAMVAFVALNKAKSE